jgi:hypothetical protein
MGVRPETLYSRAVGGQLSRKKTAVHGDQLMNWKILTASALAGGAMLLAGAPAKAQGYEYPYCTSGGWATDGICRFRTFEECMTFVQGVGGSCTRNPRAMQNLQVPPGAMRPRR